jgi:hypothetical protein
MEEQFSDAMPATSCENLSDLRAPEEMALFTYARLLNPSQIQTTSVGDILYNISQYIYNTWGVNIDGGHHGSPLECPNGQHLRTPSSAHH